MKHITQLWNKLPSEEEQKVLLALKYLGGSSVREINENLNRVFKTTKFSNKVTYVILTRLVKKDLAKKVNEARVFRWTPTEKGKFVVDFICALHYKFGEKPNAP